MSYITAINTNDCVSLKPCTCNFGKESFPFTKAISLSSQKVLGQKRTSDKPWTYSAGILFVLQCLFLPSRVLHTSQKCIQSLHQYLKALFSTSLSGGFRRYNFRIPSNNSRILRKKSTTCWVTPGVFISKFKYKQY